MVNNFHHEQAAHCESGVTRNLLKSIGVEQITEPLAFGMGAGLFFAYLPLIKINNGPAIAFRSFPGIIFKKTCNSLGIAVTRKKFSSKEKAPRDRGQPPRNGFAQRRSGSYRPKSKESR